MDKRLKKVLLFALAYALLFLVGFKVGEASHRMKNKLQYEKIAITHERLPKRYYIVETHDQGSYSNVTFAEVGDDDPVVKFLRNDKLKPLLKLRKLEIYDLEGERLY